ncbi:unnamed protein product [Peniophora sp. CBMAI 1063]|nr:unnamed protein product [Peniophora sp. CBMAI 1063]
MFKPLALAAAVVTAVSAAVVPRATVATTIGAVQTGGYATYYYQYGGYGACGSINPDSAIIVALQSQRYDSSLCGQTVSITNSNNGITIQATIADNCPGCGGNANSLDLSVGAWTAIGRSEADGSQVPITWTLIN